MIHIAYMYDVIWQLQFVERLYALLTLYSRYWLLSWSYRCHSTHTFIWLSIWMRCFWISDPDELFQDVNTHWETPKVTSNEMAYRCLLQPLCCIWLLGCGTPTYKHIYSSMTRSGLCANAMEWQNQSRWCQRTGEFLAGGASLGR